MSGTDMEDDGGMENLIDTKMKAAFKTHKEELLRDLGSLFEKISDNNNSSQLDKISSMIITDTPKFKKKSNENQYQHNAKVSIKLTEAEQAVESNPSSAIAKLAEAKQMIAHRQKLIQIADSNDLGWKMVQEYESNPLADDSDDEWRMYKAEARASRKLKAERTRKFKRNRTTPYRKVYGQTPATATAPVPTPKPGLCFHCGKAGHWKNECPGNSSNNKISIDLFSDFSQCDNSSCGFITADPCQVIQSKHETQSVCNSDPSVESPVGKLRSKAEKCKAVAGSSYVIEVVTSGYRIPFKTLPNKAFLRNNKSARDNPSFVEQEIECLQDKGVISLVTDKPYVVNPLTVAYNRKGKPRLVLDCRYINEHLHLFKIKFEDTKVAENLFCKDSFLFTFDLKSAYHHIDIFPEHKKYLGFSWSADGKTSFYVFNSLPFGIASAGHIFTKVTRVVVAYIRSHGHKIVMFLDDGIGGSNIYAQAENCSRFTRLALLDFGFLIAEEKCSWLPSRKVTWLGHIFDFESNRLFITQERICRLLEAVELALRTIALDRYSLLSVRTLASVVGQIMSLHTVLGNRVRFKTRALYNCISTRASWNSPVIVSGEAVKELRYWRDAVETLNNVGKPLHGACLYEYALFSDASAFGYGGFIVRNFCTGSYQPQVNGLELEEFSLDGFFVVGKKLQEVSVSWDKTGKKHCGKKLQEVSVSWDETGKKQCGKKLKELSISWDETGKKHYGRKLPEVSVSWDETGKNLVGRKLPGSERLVGRDR